MRKGQEEVQSIEQKAGFILRLFRGDVSLPITYWVFGILIGNVVFRFIIKIVERNNFEISPPKMNLWLIFALYCFAAIYGIFMLISIWRSAGKYKGRVVWAYLARIAVLVSTSTVMANVFMSFQNGENASISLDQKELDSRRSHMEYYMCQDLGEIAYWAATAHLSKSDERELNELIANSAKPNKIRRAIDERLVSKAVFWGYSSHGNSGDGLKSLSAARKDGILTALSVYDMCLNGQLLD
jgi:hypothetical protein